MPRGGSGSGLQSGVSRLSAVMKAPLRAVARFTGINLQGSGTVLLAMGSPRSLVRKRARIHADRLSLSIGGSGSIRGALEAEELASAGEFPRFNPHVCTGSLWKADSTARRSSCTCHPSISRGSREVQSELEAFAHDAIPGRGPAASPRRWIQVDSLGVSRAQPCESPSLWVVLFRIPWHMFRQTPSSSAQPKRTNTISPCPPERLAPL